MIKKNYYVLFLDSKYSEKVSQTEFLEVRSLARGLDAILSEVSDCSGVTLSVAFSHNVYDKFILSSLYETTFRKN